MTLLIAFAFIAGIVTVLSPCILPLLPIILASANGKRRPLGVVIGFIFSFTFFTLFLSTIVKLLNIPASSLRIISIIILTVFGLTLIIPQIQAKLEILFSKFAGLTPNTQNSSGFRGGLIVGLSLGLLWTPCVGPILASVISLAITGSVNTQAFLITLAYALGTGLPMLLIMQAGSTALQRVPWLLRNTGKIQKAFGILMILTAVGIYFNIDRKFQTFILDAFPQYGVGLTQFEDNDQVKQELEKLNTSPVENLKKGQPMLDVLEQMYPQASELIPGGEWFNSEPLKLSELKNKVVLVDFWTYSCINCQRTLPYLKNWWRKYEDQGLVIIGVHTPEFEFEKEASNVQQAIKDFELEYPIMQDNNFATWRAYNNRYWPAKYLIDKNGKIRYTHFGEGKYDETEKMIQKLLQETGSDVSAVEINNPNYQIYSRTPELYLGYSRIAYLASPEKISRDKLANYSQPKSLPHNSFAYDGDWTIMPEHAAPHKNSKLILNFEAKEVFLVARPKNNQAGKIRVSLDDSNQDKITVDADKLYQVIKLNNPGKHQLKLEFLDDNLEIFAFTFG